MFVQRVSYKSNVRVMSPVNTSWLIRCFKLDVCYADWSDRLLTSSEYLTENLYHKLKVFQTGLWKWHQWQTYVELHGILFMRLYIFRHVKYFTWYFLNSDWKFQPGNEIILTVYETIIMRLSSLCLLVKF